MERQEFEQKIKGIQNKDFYLEDRGHCLLVGVKGIGSLSIFMDHVYRDHVPESMLSKDDSRDRISIWRVTQEEDVKNDPCGDHFMFQSEEQALNYAYKKLEEYLSEKQG